MNSTNYTLMQFSFALDPGVEGAASLWYHFYIHGLTAKDQMIMTINGETVAAVIRDGQLIFSHPISTRYKGNIRILTKIALDDLPGSMVAVFGVLRKAGEECRLDCCEICGSPGPARVMQEVTLTLCNGCLAKIRPKPEMDGDEPRF